MKKGLQRMRKEAKKYIAFLIVMALCLSMMPVNVMAAEEQPVETEETLAEETEQTVVVETETMVETETESTVETETQDLPETESESPETQESEDISSDETTQEDDFKSEEESEEVTADDCVELPADNGAVVLSNKNISESELVSYLNGLVGTSYASGYCLKFVADVFQHFGAARSSTCCAYNYGNSHITSQDINSIPVGADVFFGNCGGGPCSSCKSSYYGHIGIYVGNGYFIHATGGKVQKTYLYGSTYWSTRFRGWGYHSNVTIGHTDECHCSASYAGDYTCTSNSTLNIRSGHGTSCSVIGQIPSGATVYVSKADGTWAHVSYNGVNGYVSMQYLAKKNKEVSARLHVWVSDTAMGGVPSSYEMGSTYYLCYEVLDDATGKRLSADHGDVNYTATEDIIRPDGTSAGSHSYSNSDNNWIALTMGSAGKYTGTVTLSGDLGLTVSVEWNVAPKVSRVKIHRWVSDDKMGDEPSEYVQGGWYYACYELTDDNTGMPVNGFSNNDYTLTEEVYNPDGSLEYSYTYNNADTNWIGFRAKYAGTYTLKYTINGAIGGGNFAGTATSTITVKENPTTVAADKSAVSLVLGQSESQTVNISVGGYHNGTIKLGASRSNSNVSLSWGESSNGSVPLNIKALAKGTTTVTVKALDNDSSEILANCTIEVIVTAKTYTITYSAAGAGNVPTTQTKEYGTSEILSNKQPTRFGYTFLGWSTSSSATSAEYLPGATFSRDADTTLYAVWSSAQTVGTSFPVTKNVDISMGGMVRYFKFTPPETAVYNFESSGTFDTYASLYDASGNVLESNDDSGDNKNFLINHKLTAGTTYYIMCRMYSSSVTGSYQMKVGKEAPSIGTVELVSAKDSGKASIIVSWKSVEGAEGYRIYRKTSGTGWKGLATVTSGNMITYTDSSATAGIEYTYTVRAYKMVDGKELYGGFDNTGVSASVKKNDQALGTVVLDKATDSTRGGIIVSWKAVNGAENYRIFKKFTGGSWQKVTDVTADKLSYEDSSGVTGKTYTYTVRAYKMVNGKEVLGGFDSKGLTVTKLPAKVTLKEAKADNNGAITVSWNKLSTATGYRVYRKEAGGSWKGMATLTANTVTSYTDKSVTAGKSYTYTVRAYKVYDGKTIYGNFDTNGKTATAKSVSTPGTVKLVAAISISGRKITVGWESVSNCEGYVIYRKEAGKSWTRIAKVAGSSQTGYNDGTGTAGTTYTYTVRAYKTVNSKEVMGSFDANGVSAQCKN